MNSGTIHYTYTHTQTKATTGYFSCEPTPTPSLEQALELLRASPFDDFMHRHTLQTMLGKTADELLKLMPPSPADNPVIAALLLECALLNPILSILRKKFSEHDAGLLAAYTPLPYLNGSLAKDLKEHQACVPVFSANIHGHHALPHPDDEDLPPLYLPQKSADAAPFTAEEAFLLLSAYEEPDYQPIPPEQTAANALQKLEAAGLVAGEEMRHEASLSPIAILRPWKINLQVKSGRLDYTLTGTANVYGRGLSLPSARAACVMEMVERASAYLSVNEYEIPMLAEGGQLIRASYAELCREGYNALDPDSLPLDIAYQNQSLHWIKAHTPVSYESTLVPAQFVFLFCNLDEPSLLLSPGSTGLASGNTMAEAKVSALCEIIERDAEATMPYRRSRCFTIASEEPRLKALLAGYAQRGIYPMFQNMTTSFGIPCYQSFVRDLKGRVHKGSGANLSGPSALISALTETPWPYPNGGPSGPPMPGLPRINLESLPDFNLKSPEQNLNLLEQVLQKNGYKPLYVNLTRKDLNFPVVKAIVPGLETGAEFDAFSRVSRRLFNNYIEEI